MQYAFYHRDSARNYHLPEGKALELKELFVLRKQLIQQRRITQNQIKSARDITTPSVLAISIHKHLIAFLNQQIKQVEKAIMTLIKADGDLYKKYMILISIPGIGPVIAQHVLSKTEGLRLFSSWKKLACYIGSAPFEKQSGTSLKRKPRTSKRAYRKLKADLHEGILSTIQKGRFYHDYYQQLAQQNIPHLQIINNITNIMLKVAFTLINKQQPFDKEIFLANKLSWKNNLHVS
jgi:transposase